MATGSDRYTVTVTEAAGSAAVLRETVSGCTVTVTGLCPDTEYALQMETMEGRRSRSRRFRTGAVAGTVVNYLHPQNGCHGFSGSCLCSPSLVRHPDGYLLAGMDVFGHGTPQNLTLLYRSDDEGRHWRYVSKLMPCFWVRLFIHRGGTACAGVCHRIWRSADRALGGWRCHLWAADGAAAGQRQDELSRSP